MNEIDLLKGFRDDMPEPTTDAWLRARAAIAAARAESTTQGKLKLSVSWFRPLYAVTVAIVAIVSAAAGALLTQTPAPAIRQALAPVVSPSPALRAKVAAAIQNDANYIVYTQSTTTVQSTGAVYSGVWWDYPWTGHPGSTVRQTGTEFISGSEVSSWSLQFIVPQASRLSVGSDNECQLTPNGITIDYVNHTWQAAPPPCVTLPPGLEVLDYALRMVGKPVVDGQQTTEFEASSNDKTFTVWISNVTYLPLQSQTVRKGWTEQEQYTYVVPTAANRARLALTVPHGFTQTLEPGAAS
jgi:hypothetical protein